MVRICFTENAHWNSALWPTIGFFHLKRKSGGPQVRRSGTGAVPCKNQWSHLRLMCNPCIAIASIMGRSLDNLLPSRLTFTRDDVRQRWPLYVAALGLPLTYWLLKPSRKKEDFPTDFNSYLRAPVAEAQARPAPLATSFEAFLKEQPKQVYAETDFQSFLKKQAAPAGKAATGQQAAGSKKPAEKRLVLTADLIKVTVMFGTEYGFSRDIAEKLCERIKGLGGYFPELVNMADVPEGYDFSREQAVFMACSTQGDGVPPTEAREFCEWLFGGKAGILQHLHFAVIALGDSSYEHFCRYACAFFTGSSQITLPPVHGNALLMSCPCCCSAVANSALPAHLLARSASSFSQPS